MYQNRSKQVMMERVPYYGTNKCDPTELFLTINRTSSFVIIMIGATGTISESLRQYPSNIPGKHEIKELQ